MVSYPRCRRVVFFLYRHRHLSFQPLNRNGILRTRFYSDRKAKQDVPNRGEGIGRVGRNESRIGLGLDLFERGSNVDLVRKHWFQRHGAGFPNRVSNVNWTHSLSIDDRSKSWVEISPSLRSNTHRMDDNHNPIEFHPFLDSLKQQKRILSHSLHKIPKKRRPMKMSLRKSTIATWSKCHSKGCNSRWYSKIYKTKAFKQRRLPKTHVVQ